MIEGKAATDVASDRSRLDQARERLEPGALLVASGAPFGASVGIADARGVDARIANINGPSQTIIAVNTDPASDSGIVQPGLVVVGAITLVFVASVAVAARRWQP